MYVLRELVEVIDPSQLMAQPTAPSQQMPGGNGGPQDQTVYGSAICIQSLKQLGEMYRMQGDEEGGIVCDKAALELSRHRIKKQREMQQQMADVASAIIPPML